MLEQITESSERKEDWPYWPQPGSQMDMWKYLSPKITHKSIVGYGGPKGGGKSFGLRGFMATLCFTMPVVCCLVQRTYEDLKEGHIYPLQDELKPWLEDGTIDFKKTDKVFIFNNTGSRLKLQYCRHEDDLKSFQAPQYDLLGLEEAGHFTEDEIKYMMTSNRSSNLAVQEDTNYKPRTCMTFNWGGPGHKYLRRVFWDGRYVEHVDKPADRSVYREGEDPDQYKFIFAPFDENKKLQEKDPEYQDRLKQLSPRLQKAYIDGDPDAFMGAMFQVTPFAHVVEPFEVPESFTLFAALDPGTVVCSFGLYCKSPAGRIYKIFTYYGEDRDPVEHINAINSRVRNCKWTKGRKPEYIVSDRRAIQRIGRHQIVAHDLTWKDLFADRGYLVVRGNDDRIQGAMAMQTVLAYEYNPDLDDPDVEGDPLIRKPILMFFEGLNDRTIDELRALEPDPDNPEDILHDSSVADHAYDETRYGIMSAITPSMIKGDVDESEADQVQDGYSDGINTLDDAIGSDTAGSWIERYL